MMRIRDFDIDIPADWEDHSLYSFVAPPTDASPQMTVKQAQFRKNVVLQRQVVDDATLDERTTMVVATTERDFGKIKIDVADGPSAAGAPTKRLVYKVVDSVTNQPVAQVLYVWIRGGSEWQIAFSAPALALPEAIAEFDGVVRSIRVG